MTTPTLSLRDITMIEHTSNAIARLSMVKLFCDEKQPNNVGLTARGVNGQNVELQLDRDLVLEAITQQIDRLQDVLQNSFGVRFKP